MFQSESNPIADAAAADLAWLREAIATSRRTAVRDAGPFLVWGLAIVGGLAAEQFGWVNLVLPLNPMAMWAVIVAGCWLYTLAHYRRVRRLAMVTGLGDRALATLWNACWIAMSVSGFGSALGATLSSATRMGVLAAILGLGFAATAPLLGVTMLYAVAAGWWLGAIILFAADDALATVTFAVLTLGLLVLPALVMQRRWRRVAEPAA